MLDLVRRTGHDFGISIVLSSHLMGDVERTCDRVIALDAGRISDEGSVSSFTEETQTLVVDVDRHRDELLAALAARGVQATLDTDGHSIVVEQATEEHYDAIRDAVAEAGCGLRRLAPRRHLLTDIFRSRPQ